MRSKKILFVTIPEKGHINPMIGVAQHLEQMGFELAFFSMQDISSHLKKAELRASAYFAPSSNNIDNNFITHGRDFVEKLADKNWMRQWIKTLLIDAVPEQMKHLYTIVDDFKPSLIVTDPMIYASALVADSLCLPWAGLSSSLNPITPNQWRCELTDTLDAFYKQRLKLFMHTNLTPTFKVSDLISPWLNIVFSTETYMPREICKNDVSFYVGDSFPKSARGDECEFPFEKLKPYTKKVYMSMGSQMYYHPKLFSVVAKALPEKHFQLIFSIGELMNTQFVNELPENVIPVPYAPQLQLLKQMDLLITHGGANSVLEGLAHGLPVALLPICNDQFLQARFISRAGVGIVLNPAASSPEHYRKQLLPLLEKQAPQKKAAMKIKESFARRGGAKEAANLIERLYTTQTPLMP
jgi:zeaxanthin glucosyltransferase